MWLVIDLAFLALYLLGACAVVWGCEQ